MEHTEGTFKESLKKRAGGGDGGGLGNPGRTNRLLSRAKLAWPGAQAMACCLSLVSALRLDVGRAWVCLFYGELT